MLMLLKVALVGVLPSSDECEGCSCACGAVLGRGDEFLGDMMMSCLEISAARGVLTGRKAAAMTGAARASKGCRWWSQSAGRCANSSAVPCRAVMLEGGEVAGGGDPTQADYARGRAMECLRVLSGQRGKARLVKRRPASGEEETGRDGSLADNLGCSEHIDRSGSGGIDTGRFWWLERFGVVRCCGEPRSWAEG